VYRRGAQKRGFEFTLTIEQFRVLTSGNCRYCGGSPGTVFRNYREFNGAYVYNGIDRLDNAQGYTPDNCVTCCKICNQMKHKLPVEVFLAHCARIVEYVRED
jgi:hypothetical protein